MNITISTRHYREVLNKKYNIGGLKMADEVILTSYAEDSQIKKYLQNVMMPRVFKEIPTNVLNAGAFSIFSEYMSQGMENQAFTSAFYFNESFITKAVLPDSIYAEAAIFNLGYAFAIPSSCNFLLELKIEDIMNNATYNSDTLCYEFILDKNTKFNLSNGNVYSLDYDILIQYKTIETATRGDKAWDIHYIMDNDQNSIATNKNTYIMHRVTDTWLCLMIQANEYERSSFTVVNTAMNGIPNQDTVLTCTGHICGFDIRYIDKESRETGVPKFIAKDHILPIHSTVQDSAPYVNYIMDSSQTIRFMWQLNGSKYFVPETNSSFEIIVYTSHGAAANFSAFDNTDQPNVIASTTRYANNGNVLKAAFVLSGSLGGTDIGNAEVVRRETIQAYNTANVLSSDHDLDEWFETFYFKNVLYPFFFKRRDDPWGRLWSGYIALKDDDDYVFRTNTLHGRIPYDVLYANNDNTKAGNEFIIPPGWIWKYDNNDFTVTPYTVGDNKIVENAKTFKIMSNDFIFANPFGIRVQKNPFAIGYFNPWINETVTANQLKRVRKIEDHQDTSEIYHGYPIATNIQRTYKNNYYKITSTIVPTIATMNDGEELITKMQSNSDIPIFAEEMWRYFKTPQDLYAARIPVLALSNSEGDKDRYLPYNPESTYLCVASKQIRDDGRITLVAKADDPTKEAMWIEDGSIDGAEPSHISIYAIGGNVLFVGDSSLWNDPARCTPVYTSGSTEITYSSDIIETYDDEFVFRREQAGQYYTMSLNSEAPLGKIEKIAVPYATLTDVKKFGESRLYVVSSYGAKEVTINVKFADQEQWYHYTITNAKTVYIPYDIEPEYSISSWYNFDMSNIGAGGVFLYADMRPSADAGSVDYYKIKFSELHVNEPFFYMENSILDFEKNNMRVILHAMVNGAETGRIEMIPVDVNSDGSYQFEADMYPLNELVDIDNRINIASRVNGGGSWIPTSQQNVVIDATDPEFKITILVRSQYPDHVTDIGNDRSYDGYIIVDEFKLEKFSLIQELKEMRSVVDFSDASVPSPAAVEAYNEMTSWISTESKDLNIYDIIKFINNHMIGTTTHISLAEAQSTARIMWGKVLAEKTKIIDTVEYAVIDDELYDSIVESLRFIGAWDHEYQLLSREEDNFKYMYYNNGIMYENEDLTIPITPQEGIFYCNRSNDNMYIMSPEDNTRVTRIQLMIWDDHYDTLNKYSGMVEDIFVNTNVHSGVTIQLMPFTEYSLLTSDRFPSFISSFTQVHKAIEPVIFSRLDGNDYLDTKLIATYGRPHTYTTEYHKSQDDGIFWPDLNIQIEFDIMLKNQSIATDTLSKLRSIIKSYFSKLTTVHTAREKIDMDSNIYITELIRRMLEEKSNNVSYLKFVGWYTQDRYSFDKSSKFMDANTQSIVQKWTKIDDFPKQELERFTPEMFIVDDSNIIFNVL